MDISVIQTGSSGNAVVLNGFLMVDCGVQWNKIEPVYKDLKIVLTSHQHGDHFKSSTVSRLAKERPTLRFGACEWMLQYLIKAGVKPHNIDIYEPGKRVRYEGLTVEAVPVPHNVPNCGYKLAFGDKPETVFYATDCATLDGIDCHNYDFYLIEANHRRNEIEQRIHDKVKSGEYAYEMSAMRNHLSEEQAIEFLARNAGPNSRYVFLHVHKDRAKSTI